MKTSVISLTIILCFTLINIEIRATESYIQTDLFNSIPKFKKLKKETQKNIIIAYRSFAAEVDKNSKKQPILLSNFVDQLLNFISPINSIQADESKDCLFGSWHSQGVIYQKRFLCNSFTNKINDPAVSKQYNRFLCNNKPDDLVNNICPKDKRICKGEKSFLCNPALYGLKKPLCIIPSPPKYGSLADDCLKSSKSEGKDLEEFIDEILENKDLFNLLKETMDIANSFCPKAQELYGKEDKTGHKSACDKLYKRVSDALKYEGKNHGPIVINIDDTQSANQLLAQTCTQEKSYFSELEKFAKGIEDNLAIQTKVGLVIKLVNSQDDFYEFEVLASKRKFSAGSSFTNQSKANPADANVSIKGNIHLDKNNKGTFKVERIDKGISDNVTVDLWIEGTNKYGVAVKSNIISGLNIIKKINSEKEIAAEATTEIAPEPVTEAIIPEEESVKDKVEEKKEEKKKEKEDDEKKEEKKKEEDKPNFQLPPPPIQRPPLKLPQSTVKGLL